MQIDVKRLRTFHLVVEHKSFSVAANQLNMGTTWVTTQVRQLEQYVGAELIQRSKGQYVGLTTAGEAVQTIAADVVCAWDKYSQSARDLEDRRDRLRLGTAPSTADEAFRVKLITEFLKRFPEIRLLTSTARSMDLHAGLRSGLYDLIITVRPLYDADIEELHLYSSALAIAVPKGSDLFADGSITLDELRGRTLMILGGQHHPSLIQWVRSAMDGLNIDWIESPERHQMAITRHAESLGIIALVSETGSIPLGLEDRVKMRRVDSAQLKVDWVLARRRSIPQTRAPAEAFWNLGEELLRSGI